MTEHNQKAIAGLEPAPVWRIFAEMASVPRPSKDEARIQAHMKTFAEGCGFAVTHEPVGNLIVRVPATKGHENAPTVVIQGHLDMVAEKNSGTKHDFHQDPIRLVRDRDAKTGAEIMRADGTTLGADNGMGVALALAAATEKDVRHGPLEILLTCDEEAGMTGAKAVTPTSIKGRTLINLDSEEDDSLYIGCAGGADTTLHWNLPVGAAASGAEIGEVHVTGLTGGHSGCDIHLNRGNAIKLLARTLLGADAVQLAALHGGSMRNAIPREAHAVVAAAKGAWEAIKKAAAELEKTARATGEPGCKIEVKTGGGATNAATADASRRVLHAVASLPSGVLALVPTIPGLVQTSNNVSTAKSRTNGKLQLEVGCLSRSSSSADIQQTTQQLHAVAALSGADVTSGNSYPGWQPNADSKLLALCRDVYQQQFNEAPRILAIHAGLECGIIGERVGGDMDMISFGPTIMGAHSPDERIEIASVQKIWKYLRAVLAALA